MAERSIATVMLLLLWLLLLLLLLLLFVFFFPCPTPAEQSLSASIKETLEMAVKTLKPPPSKQQKRKECSHTQSVCECNVLDTEAGIARYQAACTMWYNCAQLWLYCAKVPF